MTMETSESVSDLFAALGQFGGLVQAPQRSGFNPATRSKYSTLADVKEAVRPAMAKCGLFLVQSPLVEAGGVGVETTITHASGQWCRSRLVLPVSRMGKGAGQISLAEATVQECGSALTYASRYAMLAMLNLAGVDDDDGNAASGRQEQAQNQHYEQPQANGRQTSQQSASKPAASAPEFPNHKTGPAVDLLVKGFAEATTAQHFAELAKAAEREHGPWATTGTWHAFKAAVASREINMADVWKAKRESEAAK